MQNLGYHFAKGTEIEDVTQSFVTNEKIILEHSTHLITSNYEQFLCRYWVRKTGSLSLITLREFQEVDHTSEVFQKNVGVEERRNVARADGVKKKKSLAGTTLNGYSITNCTSRMSFVANCDKYSCTTETRKQGDRNWVSVSAKIKKPLLNERCYL